VGGDVGDVDPEPEAVALALRRDGVVEVARGRRIDREGGELGEVALVPGTGGIFVVRVDEVTVWDGKERGGFPELAELKRKLPVELREGPDAIDLDSPEALRQLLQSIEETLSLTLGGAEDNSP